MQRTNEIQGQLINGMENLIENRDASTGKHVKRTGFYVKSIVDKLRAEPAYHEVLSEKTEETIVDAAPLHDIGKIIVADRILQKPGKLTPEEYEEIKLPASEGAKVIENWRMRTFSTPPRRSLEATMNGGMERTIQMLERSDNSVVSQNHGCG